MIPPGPAFIAVWLIYTDKTLQRIADILGRGAHEAGEKEVIE